MPCLYSMVLSLLHIQCHDLQCMSSNSVRDISSSHKSHSKSNQSEKENLRADSYPIHYFYMTTTCREFSNEANHLIQPTLFHIHDRQVHPYHFMQNKSYTVFRHCEKQ